MAVTPQGGTKFGLQLSLAKTPRKGRFKID